MDNLRRLVQELETHETIYRDLVSWGQITDIETISKFRDWYTCAIKVFYHYVGENDPYFQTFKSVDTSGNGYCLLDVFDSLQADYTILLEKVKNRIQCDADMITIHNTNNNEIIEDIWQIMHPEIIRVAQQRFNAGFYADAVEAALKEINLQVKTKCKDRHQNKDGKGLMTIAFSANNPVLKFEPSSSYSDFDIQDGYMHMFAGAMQGIRNPKAHENDVIDKADALRKLAFASMLMYKLDTVVE